MACLQPAVEEPSFYRTGALDQNGSGVRLPKDDARERDANITISNQCFKAPGVDRCRKPVGQALYA